MRHFLAFAALFLAWSAHAQVDRSAYAPSTIEDAIVKMENSPGMKYNFDAAHSRYLLTAVFTGESRPLSAQVRKYLETWVSVFRHPASYVDLFESEVAIQQNGRQYWMPIQQSLVEAFNLEVRPDRTVDLYVTAIGDHHEQPVFLVNAFTAR